MPLCDGAFVLPLDSLATNVDKAVRKTYFDANYMSAEKFQLQLTPLLISTRGKNMLVDTGPGPGQDWAPDAGRLARSQSTFQGQLVAEFNQLDDDPESEKERRSGEPLLEIYNPVRQPWSGEVVAVSEFYEVAPDLARDLTEAADQSWLAVAGGTLFFFLILSAIVLRGSRTIDAQARSLSERVAELSALLEQNRALRLGLARRTSAPPPSMSAISGASAPTCMTAPPS